jgi:hypothetical protein
MNYIRLENLLKLFYIVLSAIVIVVLFFQVPLIQLHIIPNFLDELILLFILFVSLLKSRTNLIIKHLMFIYAGAFVFYFILSIGSIPYRGLFQVLLQIFIHLKFILFISFVWMTLKPKYALIILYILSFITLFFLLFNLATGSYFNEIFDVVTQNRGGWVRPIGIQANTGSLGTVLALFCCLWVCGLESLQKNVRIIILLVFSVFIILSTVRVAFLVIPLIILWWLKDSLKSFFVILFFILLMFFSLKSNKLVDELVDITVQNIEWTIDNPVESSYIRGIMIFFSVELANEHFPIGTGAATYGTVTSTDSYVYAEIGLQNSRFFIDKEGIYDSNLASLLGEFGYLGVLIYFYIFYRIINLPVKLGLYEQRNEFKFVFFSFIAISSLVSPVFMNTFPAFMLALVLVASYHRVHCIEN